MGIRDNIKNLFNSEQVEEKTYGNFPNSQIVFPFNSDIGFFSGTNQMSPEGNSAALACLNVLGTAFSEPPLEVYQATQEGEEKVLNHPASMLMKKPSPYLSGSLLNQYIISSISVAGDSFILKLRNDSGQVVQLYPLIPDQVEVKGNNEELITHYEYKQKGQTLHIKREDIIHLREKIDPRNHRRGLAPLRSVLVEVLGDAAASQMAAALVKNMGVPGVVISPKNDLSMTSDEAENIAEVFGRRFGGENRGRPLVISGGEVDIQTLSFTPRDLEIGKLRHVNEERISAVLGVPAILAGLGSGLANATYSNAKELREFFTEQKLIPMWKNVSNDLTNQLLLEDFEDDSSYSFKYDLSDVRALSQDEDAEMQRVVQGLNAGFITVAEARKATGFSSDNPNMDVYLRGLTQVEVPADGSDVRIFSGQVPTGDPVLPIPNKSIEEKAVSKRIENILRDKVDEHNDKDPKYRATFSMLRQVFERGVGAYNTNPESVRPSVTSSDQWALARVNTFLGALRTGKFKNKPFDTDLLPDNHPLSTSGESEDDKYGKPKKPRRRKKAIDNVPSYIQKNAERGLELLEFAGSGLTDKTKREAREMAKGNISDDKVVRMAAWFARHVSDLDSEEARDYLLGKGDISAGQVAWLLWGGDLDNENKLRAMKWAEREVEKLEEKSIDLYGWEEPTTKFLGLPTVKQYKTKDEKFKYWKSVDDLRIRWEDLITKVYGKELNRQKREVLKALEGSQDVKTFQTNTDIVLENSKFDKELLPLYYSLGDDFSVRTYDNLFPQDNNFKAASEGDLGVRIQEEEAIETVFTTLSGLLSEGRTLKKVVEDGFYRGQREVPKAVGSLFQDGQAAGFLQENSKNVMNDLNATTKKRISKVVSDTLKEFEDLGIVNPVKGSPEGDRFFKQLSKNINNILGGQSLTRARVIARTEVLKASSWSQQRAAKSTGKTLEKEWLSQRDDRVRESHFILDNQRVPADSFYLYNGIKLDHPGDPKAPAGLIVNCRCTEMFIEVIDE